MKKRILSFISIMALVLSLCGGAALAVEPRASDTISIFVLAAAKGNNAGEFKVKYDVMANESASRVGISSIVIYKGDSSYVTTITGSVANGLIVTNKSRHNSSYIYEGTPGESYYAIVTCTATIGSKSDSRTLTTDTVTTPS